MERLVLTGGQLGGRLIPAALLASALAGLMIACAASLAVPQREIAGVWGSAVERLIVGKEGMQLEVPCAVAELTSPVWSSRSEFVATGEYRRMRGAIPDFADAEAVDLTVTPVEVRGVVDGETVALEVSVAGKADRRLVLTRGRDTEVPLCK